MEEYEARKLCPLKQNDGKRFGYCDGEKCAWWSKYHRNCVILFLKGGSK